MSDLFTDAASVRRTALVTGGTGGIGKAVAGGLARQGLRVIIVGRNADKGRRVEEEIRATSGNADVTFIPGDVGLVRNARKLADDVASIAPTLHFLVHGAGIVRGRYLLTTDGIESNFAVNYVARFILTTRLLPSLLAAGRPGGSSRVLILGGAARSGTIHFDDPNLTSGFTVPRFVGQFCQANDVLAIELARRLAGSRATRGRVTVTCLKIGVVKTGIRREFPFWMKVLVPLVLDPFLALTPEDVARHALRLLLDETYEGAEGSLFLLIRRFKPIEPNASARDPETGRRLWALSERLVDSTLHKETAT